MSKILLKLISIDTLIEAVGAFLASTVKNPTSPEATRLRGLVWELYEVTGTFLDVTTPKR